MTESQETPSTAAPSTPPETTVHAESPAPAVGEAQDKEGSSWLGMLIRGTSTFLIVLVTLVAYHFLVVAPNKQRFGVVDVAEVLNLKELQVTLAASQPDAGENRGAAAFEEIARFAKDIEVALAEIQQECGCSLFVKAAVVKPAGAEDLTPLLKQRLGMDKIDQAQLVQQLRATGGRGQAPMLETPRK